MARRILAVDDNAQFLEMLTAFFTEQGYEVVTAADASNAYMIVTMAPPDVVLLDIGMPGVDGVTALRRIRACRPELPIIICSANLDIARDSLQRAAFDYIAKPVDFDHLSRAVEAAVGNRA